MKPVSIEPNRTCGEMVFADSHAHLEFEPFNDDREAVVARALEAGVRYVNTIGTRLSEAADLCQLAERYENVMTSVGVHPHYVEEEKNISLETILQAAAHPKVVAIGETGLDFYYGLKTRKQQERAFREHIRAARASGLPLIVHTREAESETRRILEEEGGDQCGGVLHCFSGSNEMAQWAVDFGFHLSFSGIVTFKNANSLREIVTMLPLDRLLIETDAPYLAPVPYRGKRNEPAYVVHVAETLAKVRGISLAEIARCTLNNYKRLFRVSDTDETAAETLAYPIGSALYLNVTHGCTLHCDFCPKWGSPVVHSYHLALKRNPSAEALIHAMGDIASYQEIVFCGYGEPTLRLDVVLSVARVVKSRGKQVRLNTDGLANRLYGEDVTPRFRGLIDAVSISLNAQDEATYEHHCHPGMSGSYGALLDFVRAVKCHVPDVTLTAIEGVEGVDIEACRRIATSLGVRFRPRFLNKLG